MRRHPSGDTPQVSSSFDTPLTGLSYGLWQASPFGDPARRPCKRHPSGGTRQADGSFGPRQSGSLGCPIRRRPSGVTCQPTHVRLPCQAAISCSLVRLPPSGKLHHAAGVKRLPSRATRLSVTIRWPPSGFPVSRQALGAL